MEANVLSAPPPAAANRHSTTSCCSTPYDGQSKMLHSLLYNFGNQHLNNAGSNTDRERGGSRASSPRDSSPHPTSRGYTSSPSHYHHHHNHSSSSHQHLHGSSHHHYHSQSGSAPSHHSSPVPAPHYTAMDQQLASAAASTQRTPLRPRSSSVVSLGSTGSSLRDSYSPSHDSSTSPDGSLSRASPASLTSSPSPSPPASAATPGPEAGGKLFGLLKGTITSPYTSFFGSPSSSSFGMRSRTPTRSPRLDGSIPAAAGSPSQIQSPPPPVLPSHQSSLKRALVNRTDEQPMDLSCKSKRIRSDSPGPLTPQSQYSPYRTPTSPAMSHDNDDNDAEESGPSILKSILCGGAGLNLSRSNPTPNSSVYNSSLSPVSPGPPILEPQSPLGRQTSTPVPCGARQRRSSTSSVSSTTSSRAPSTSLSRVALAKKMLYPVRARVSDWMLKVVQFAKSQPEFASLPSIKDKLALMAQSWARILLLFMAETNFEFAVTPIHMGEEENGPMWDPECPTMQSVQAVQGFIKKCQTLNLDSREYHYMRMAVLFHTGSPGMENADFVDKVNSYVRQSLQDHITTSRPHDRLRYSSLLLCIHTLYGINCKMVDNLFCRHLVKEDEDISHMLQDMLETYDNEEAESQENDDH